MPMTTRRLPTSYYCHGYWFGQTFFLWIPSLQQQLSKLCHFKHMIHASPPWHSSVPPFTALHLTSACPQGPPLFPTLNLWNLSCPSGHINLDSTCDLSENSLKLLRRMQFSFQTVPITAITQHFLESLGITVPVTENLLLAGNFFHKAMTICRNISVSIEPLQ